MLQDLVSPAPKLDELFFFGRSRGLSSQGEEGDGVDRDGQQAEADQLFFANLD